ncbi:MAG: hypothetical protein LBH29_05785 [Elusimicrobiota bacterium]|nr:hypothetical protein [Elusimicrobiota bacterium]
MKIIAYPFCRICRKKYIGILRLYSFKIKKSGLEKAAFKTDFDKNLIGFKMN